MHAVDLIRKKRDGEELTREEIDYVCRTTLGWVSKRGAAEGGIAQAQLLRE